MENFDRENIDKLLEIHQIRQYFPRQNFVPPYGIIDSVATMHAHEHGFSYMAYTLHNRAGTLASVL